MKDNIDVQFEFRTSELNSDLVTLAVNGGKEGFALYLFNGSVSS